MVIRLFSLDARTPQDRERLEKQHIATCMRMNWCQSIPLRFRSILILNCFAFTEFNHHLKIHMEYSVYTRKSQDSNSEPSASMLNVSDRNSAVSIGCRYGQEHRRRGTLAHAVAPVPCMLLRTCRQFRLSLHRTAGAAPVDGWNPGHAEG